MSYINQIAQVPTEIEGQTQPSAPHDNNIPSVLALAQTELSEFQSDALDETLEDLGFALGGRLKGMSGKEEVLNKRSRVLMHKLVAEVAVVERSELEHQLDDGAWQQAPQLLAALQAEHPEPGAAALQLALWLAYGKPGARMRTRMEQALTSLMGEEEMSLSLFGALEFGVVTPGLRQELVRLYQRACAPRQKLSEWFTLLGERRQRQRKIRTMLRILSYELSASGQPIVGSHLAAVIGDLRQLLRLLGLETYCDQAAMALDIPAISGEELMAMVVQLIEQYWVTDDSLEEVLSPQSAMERYRLLYVLGKLIQLLPDECFGDSEQRNQLYETIRSLSDRYAE
ncbi:TyeA family type III secretion system gatekeeper subunit [Salmonella enterica]|nr:TyeA family type III secretion system gatekeeper subunit [Salmonella enterica subsp. enterica serovar Sandiego]EEC0252001.1 TyeA family type III secretion system gatekeeper subunit [Salmonella enterica subsp. enterica]EJW2129124.1 TyeA family type III secretion system gatekeeper subunit [Salmonella enterica]EEE4266795.1 TyeA family type III secretion system gatekeeper subunit [Salmonella enterica subsp. enterica serovar Sandiego]EKT1705069.1 TyeA family type III secretion system gatekeeper s